MLLLFYCSIVLSIVFLTLALIKTSYFLLILTVILAMPSAIYFSGYPYLRFAILIPFIYIAFFLVVKKMKVPSN